MKDYTLPILLLTKVCRHYSQGKQLRSNSDYVYSGKDSDYDEPADNPAPLSSLNGNGPTGSEIDGKKDKAATDRQVEKVFCDLVEVLILLEGFPAALAKVLLPVFER